MTDLINSKNIISSNITLFRNIKGHKFPKAIDIDQGRELAEIIITKFKNINENAEVYRLWEDKCNFENLKEERILRNKTLKNKNIAAMIIDKKNNFSFIVNEEEHLRLQIIENGYNTEEMYKNVKELDGRLEKEISYMFNEKMGFLTSNLSHIGTGLQVGVLVHLPMLTLNEKINKLFSRKDKSTFSLEGKYGERGKAYGNIYLIKNTTTTGVQEEELIKEFIELVEFVLEEEGKERKKALKKYKNEIEDKIYRAYGVLKEARILDSIEALSLLSYIRLGAELGILSIDFKTVEEAILLSRNSYVKECLDGEKNLEKINLKRAEIIRNILN